MMTMTRAAAGFVLVLCVALWAAPSRAGADDAGAVRAAAKKRAAAKPVDPEVPANITDPEGFGRELQAARDQRDRDLKEAAKETDRKRFEKRKADIFAQYASIVAAMRDKYTAASPPPKTAKTSKTAKPATVRPTAGERFSAAARPAAPKSKRPPEPTPPAEDPAALLADAQKRLDDENARHGAKLEELNAQLKEAQASENQREIRKAQRAIEKENAAYDAKIKPLQRRVKELGGGRSDAVPPLKQAAVR
jgi:hypothetical protein